MNTVEGKGTCTLCFRRPLELSPKVNRRVVHHQVFALLSRFDEDIRHPAKEPQEEVAPRSNATYPSRPLLVRFSLLGGAYNCLIPECKESYFSSVFWLFLDTYG